LSARKNRRLSIYEGLLGHYLVFFDFLQRLTSGYDQGG
jgi:hypothetical protein